MKADVEGEQRRLRRAARGANENNEHNLRRIGTELYSGPVQLISLALLKIEAVCASAFTGGDQVLPRTLRTSKSFASLGKTLDEMRNVSSELILFEIENLSLADLVRMAARRHARKTGQPVRCDAGDVAAADVHGQLKTCFYRFAREGLDRASHYATGCEHVVRASRDGESIGIEVTTGQPNQTGQQEAFLRSESSLRDRVKSWRNFRGKERPRQGCLNHCPFCLYRTGCCAWLKRLPLRRSTNTPCFGKG